MNFKGVLPKLARGQTKRDHARLLFGGAGETATKPLGFAPRLTNLFPETGKPGCYLDDKECDHGYRHVLESRRLI